MRVKIIFALLILNLTLCINAQEFKAVLVPPPVATAQLGPSVFLPECDIEELGIIEGIPVKLTINNISTHLRLYNSFGENRSIGLRKNLLSIFNVNYNDTINFAIEKLCRYETELEPKQINFSVENYKGDLSLWKGYAIGAPHGDCDLETGAIVKIVSEQYGIPSTAAYGCRLSYRGIWYDCNRPLMKEAKDNGKGVIPERLWNERSEEKYSTFQDSVWENSNLKYGKRFKLYTSFHGHDLTVKLKDGKRIQRPVIEAMGVGFTKEELRRIKEFYYRNKNKYYENAPALYFGNLSEDLTYEYKGIPLTFFYTGLGTRTYGSLRSDFAEYILHFETPNSMRINPKIHDKTAMFLNDIYLFVRDSIFTNNDASSKHVVNYKTPSNIGGKVRLAGGEFLFGAPKGFGWSSERPQRKVVLSPFEIDIYEVTNMQYCAFLNKAYLQSEIELINGKVVAKGNKEKILFLTSDAVTFSEIRFSENQFIVKKDRECHPVVYVTYYGAEKYAVSKGERLPTEAEWEYAASWDGNKKFLYGTAENVFNESASNFEDSGDPYENVGVINTTPVGFYKASSPGGCKDMSGNVWEWCSDYYNSKTHLLIEEAAKDPGGVCTGTMKVIKGGAWNTEGPVTSSTKRLGIHPNAALVNLGFRCIKVDE